MGASDTTLQQAIAAHQAGRLDEADAAYQEVLRLIPDNPDALHFMGLLRFQSGDPAAAVELIARSLDRDPGNPNAWNNLANMLSLAGKVTEAQEAYRRVMSLAPERAEAYYNLALSLRDHDEPGQAVHYLQQAIVRSPNFFRAYETLAMLCYRLGDARGAAETYRVWSLRDPGNAKARHMAAATTGNDVPGGPLTTTSGWCLITSQGASIAIWPTWATEPRSWWQPLSASTRKATSARSPYSTQVAARGCAAR